MPKVRLAGNTLLLVALLKEPTSGIESLWDSLKRTHTGTHDKWSRKRLRRYLSEYCRGLNQRKMGALESLGERVRKIDAKRLL